MIRLGFLFGFAVACALAQQPTVSNIHFDGIGDSSARVIFDASGTFNTFRLRYGTANTASGTGGTIQINGTSPGTYVRMDMTANLSGLAPNTMYFVSPEVSNNGGTNWSNGVSATLTTLPRTQTLPIPPVPVSTNFPAQTGATRNVATNCSNLQAQINAAQPGDTIVVPAGAICAGNYSLPIPPGVKTFLPASVRTSDSTVTINGHGFTENQEVRVSTSSANSNCLPGMTLFAYAATNCDYGGDGWRKGGRYWVHVPDANHVQILNAPGGNPVLPGWLQFSCSPGADTITFRPTWETPFGISYLGSPSVPANTPVQFHSTDTPCGGLAINTRYFLLTACPASQNAACTTKVSLSANGTPVDISSAGTGVQRIVDQGNGTMYMAAAPDPNGPWIVITSGGDLPPAGIRTSPGFDAKGFHLRQATPLPTNIVFIGGILSRNWRVVGAIFDTATNTDYQTTFDPRPYCSILTINQDNENIVFDRSRVQGPGYPNRFGCGTAIFLNGRNTTLINSDLRGMDYWHPWTTGFAATINATSVTLAAGSAFAGPSIFNKKTTGPTIVTVTNGGGVSGTVYIYFAMDGNIKVQPPSGVSLTCVSTGATCTVLPGVASPNFPVDARGRSAALKLASFALTGGSVASACAIGCMDAVSSVNNAEGTAGIIAGTGPGPYLFDNNFISGTGIPLHFDDSGGPFQRRGDYTVTRNTFDVPASQLATKPASDGLRYGHRNSLEWKGGQRIKVDGNIFQGSFSEVSPACVTVAMTPRAGGYVTDFDFTNNTVIGCGGLSVPAPIDSQHPVSKPAQRTRIANNLFLLNGTTYSVQGVGTGRGWTLQGGYGAEDVLIDHNTSFDARGVTPSFLYWQVHPIGGMKVTNNVFFYTGNIPAVQGESVGACGFAANKTLMDCAFTNGPGNPGYTFSNNVIVPSWADSTNPSASISAAVVNGAFPSPLKNSIPNAGSLAANLGLIKFAAADVTGTYKALDLRLAAQSPYIRTASDGTQAGADLEKLQQAQGEIIQLRPLTVSSTAATISAYVPAVGIKCYVGYGTSNIAANWTWTAADTTNNRERNIPISGLTPQTRYFYSMTCAGAPMPSIEAFRTQ